MLTLAQWIARLTKGYIKFTGKQPDKLSKLKIKMEAGQKVRDQEKVIKVDFGKKKPWHEKKAGGGIAGMLGERTGYNGGGSSIPTREQMLKILKEDLKREFAKQRDPFPKPGDKEFKDLELKLQQIFAKDRLKSASGGLAGMLGEPTYVDDNHRVPFGRGSKVLDLLTLIRSKFGKDAITTADTIKRPTKVIEAEKTKKMFDDFNNKIATQEALSKGSKKMAGPIENINRKSIFEPTSSDATTWLQQEKFFNPKALDMYGKKVPANWIAKEKKAAQKLIDDLGPLDVSPNHPNYKDMKAIRQSAKDRLASIKITEALGGNIQMHDWIRMNRKNIKISDYIKKPGTKKAADELSGIKKAFVQKKLSPEEELRREFPGISDDLIKNILADKNPQRIAEVKAAMKEAMKMQEKGMNVDEIINIFKNMKRTKNASGGLAGMLGE